MNCPKSLLWVVLAGALSSCTAPMPDLARGIDASDEELLATLASLAQRGTGAICNPSVLERELGIRIGKLETRSPGPSSGVSLLHQESQDVRPVRDEGQIKEGGYKRVRSPLTSHCHIYIQFRDQRLCKAWSPRTAALMGVPMTIGPYPLHGPQRGAVLFVYKPNDGESVVGLGNDGQLCANGFGISSEGEWK